MENWDWVWQTIIIYLAGQCILRIGGRKSISQMTITQTIVMIGLGSLLIQPLAGRGILITLGVALLFILLMIITEFLETKVDLLETIFTGKSVIVIENGKPVLNNLKKLRLSVDRLETRLRQSGISSIEDVKHATIEVSGQLGYELIDNKKPLTKEDFIILMSELNTMQQMYRSIKAQGNSSNIFEEIKSKEFEGNKNEH